MLSFENNGYHGWKSITLILSHSYPGNIWNSIIKHLFGALKTTILNKQSEMGKFVYLTKKLRFFGRK